MSRYQFSLSAALFSVLLLGASPTAAMLGGGDSSDSDGFTMAKQMAMDGKHTAAIEKLNEVLKDDPKNADAWNLLGFSSRMTGAFDNAEKYYDNALSIDANHLGALNYMGQMFVQTGRIERAREMLVKLQTACDGTCEEYTQLATAIKDGKAGNY